MAMKASLKGKYDADKTSGIGSIAFNAGDIKLRATMTDATLVAGPTLNGLSLAVEKPGSFIVEYNVPKKVKQQHSLIESKPKKILEIPNFSILMEMKLIAYD